jgi:hypothetical protein
MSPYSLDSAPREPLTLTAILPLILGYYTQAVLVILPNTSTFRVLLLPFILWQAWRCAIGFDFAAQLAQLLGRQNSDRLSFWNLYFAVRSFSKGMFPGAQLLKLRYRAQCSA